MQFDKGHLPPVQAFWSLTAYDKDGYFIVNPLNRYAIGDRDPLPCGDGRFNLTIRLLLTASGNSQWDLAAARPRTHTARKR